MELAEEIKIGKFEDSLIFIGCSPCQYWSRINTNREKSKATKDLLKEFQRFVAWFKPAYVLVENVPHFLKHKDENVLGEFLSFLENESYVYNNEIVDANYYGVPQNRKRYLLIASRVSSQIKIPERESSENLTVRNFIGVHNGFKAIEAGHQGQR